MAASRLSAEQAFLGDFEVAAGPHRLETALAVSGWGEGPFAFLKDYRAELPKQVAFALAPGEARCVSIVSFYRDGVTLPVEQRPALQLIEERARSATRSAPQSAAGDHK